MILHPGSSTIYVFGGWDNHRTFFNDVYALHSYGTRWSQVTPQVGREKPTARMGHTAVMYRNSMIILGGFDEMQLLRNDVWEFNLASLSWREHRPTGTPPCPRYRHTTVLLNDFMFVIGGVDINKQRFNDVYVYDILQETWYEFLFPPSAEFPSPRSFHQAALVRGAVYVVGGMSGSMKLGDTYRLLTPNFSTPDSEPQHEPRDVVDAERVHQGATLAKVEPPPTEFPIDAIQKKILYYENKILCKVCFENEINCVLLPCAHRAVCMACASEIVNRANPCCPICRVDITRIFPTIDA